MDAEAILQGLRLERKIAEQRVTDLDEAIGMFEKLSDGHRSVGGSEKHASNGSGARGKRAVVDWTRARQMYENAGSKVLMIAKALKCSEATIYNRAKAEGWKRPSSTT